MKNKSDLLVNTDEDLDYMEENKEKSSSKKMDPSNTSTKNYFDTLFFSPIIDSI